MAYTRVWSNAVLGTNAANTIDTLLANIREDLNERLTDVLGISSFTADPLVLTSIKLNRAADTKILAGTNSLTIRNAADSANLLKILNSSLILTQGVVTAAVVSLSLPAGSIVLGVGSRLAIDDGAIIQSVLWYDTALGGITTLANGHLTKLQMYNNEAANAGRDGIVAAWAGGNNKLVWFADGQRFYVVGTAF